MPVKFWFWLVMAIWFVFRLWWEWPSTAPNPYRAFLPGHLLLFLLFCFLGWHEFGAPWNALVSGN